jgi:hypothetical protein
MPSDDAIATCEASAQPATADAAAAPHTAAPFSRVDGVVDSSSRDLRASRRVVAAVVSIVVTVVVVVAHCRCGLCSYPPKASTAPSTHPTTRAKRKPITTMIVCVLQCNPRPTGPKDPIQQRRRLRRERVDGVGQLYTSWVRADPNRRASFKVGQGPIPNRKMSTMSLPC